MLKKSDSLIPRWTVELVVLQVTLLAFVSSCAALVTFRELSLTTNPSEANQVISQNEDIWVEFSLPVNQRQAEQNLSLSSPSAAVELDYAWQGERVTLKPIDSLDRGVRYELAYDGTISSPEGGEYDAALILPFFVVTSDAPARIASFSPESGAVVPVDQPLTLTFDGEMDQRSAEAKFSLSPGTEVAWEWSDDGTSATVLPQPAWTANERYSWELPATVKDAAGVPLQAASEGTFVTQDGTAPPEVLSRSAATFTGSDLLAQASLGYRDALLIEFSQEMDFPTVESAWSISPSVTGRFIRVDARTIAFVSEDVWDLAKTYTLTVDATAASTAGVPMVDAYRELLNPDIPPQSVTGIALPVDPSPVEPSGYNGEQEYELDLTDTGTEFENEVVISFSEPYAPAYRPAVQDEISVRPLFPSGASLPTPDVKAVAWPSDTQVRITYVGYAKPEATQDANETWYYELRIRGGAEGTINQNGSYLPRDVWLLLRVRESS